MDSSSSCFFLFFSPLLFCVQSPSAMELWMTGAGSGWNWWPLFHSLHVGGLGQMVAEWWEWIASLFGSYQGDRAALLRIHTAHLQWRRGLEKVAQTLPVPPFQGGLPQPQGHPTRGRKKYKIDSSIKQRPLVVASCNVRTLQDIGLGARRRTALIACEHAKYNIDIAALSETRLPDEGSLVEMGTGYIFFWSGLPTVARRIHDVGFADRTALLQAPKNPPLQ